MDLPTTQVEHQSKELTRNTLKLITWNIDGINGKEEFSRMEAVANRICSEEADIVFLQEVIPRMDMYFPKKLSGYTCTFGNTVGYYVAIFLKKSSVKYTSHEIIEFPTDMGRNLLKVNANFGCIPLLLMTTHLESSKAATDCRKLQLRTSVKNMCKASANHAVIFGGDLNLRDQELADLGGLPAGIEDVWVSCGSDENNAYTWDLTRNDNMTFPEGNQPRFRFDRVFFRDTSPSHLKPVSFELIGLERLPIEQCFPSDHFGILCNFEVS